MAIWLVLLCQQKFACNGTVIEHPEYGEVIQLQGDQRKNICTFLIEVGLTLFPAIAHCTQRSTHKCGVYKWPSVMAPTDGSHRKAPVCKCSVTGVQSSFVWCFFSPHPTSRLAWRKRSSSRSTDSRSSQQPHLPWLWYFPPPCCNHRIPFKIMNTSELRLFTTSLTPLSYGSSPVQTWTHGLTDVGWVVILFFPYSFLFAVWRAQFHVTLFVLYKFQ